MRQYRISKELRLPGSIFAPNFQHDVRAACSAIFFDLLNTFLRRSRNHCSVANLHGNDAAPKRAPSEPLRNGFNLWKFRHALSVYKHAK